MTRAFGLGIGGGVGALRAGLALISGAGPGDHVDAVKARFHARMLLVTKGSA